MTTRGRRQLCFNLFIPNLRALHRLHPVLSDLTFLGCAPSLWPLLLSWLALSGDGLTPSLGRYQGLPAFFNPFIVPGAPAEQEIQWQLAFFFFFAAFFSVIFLSTVPHAFHGWSLFSSYDHPVREMLLLTPWMDEKTEAKAVSLGITSAWHTLEAQNVSIK